VIMGFNNVILVVIPVLRQQFSTVALYSLFRAFLSFYIPYFSHLFFLHFSLSLSLSLSLSVFISVAVFIVY